MKKAIAVLAFALFLSASLTAGNIKEAKVPIVVKEYVAKNYPRVYPVEWNYDQQTNVYNALFKIETLDYSLDIASDGQLIGSDIQVTSTQLPRPVMVHIAKLYPGYKIKDARKMTRQGEVTYKVIISMNNEDQTLLLTPEGRQIDRRPL